MAKHSLVGLEGTKAVEGGLLESIQAEVGTYCCRLSLALATS